MICQRREKGIGSMRSWWKKRRGKWLLLLTPASLLLLFLARQSVYFTEEVFAKRIYPVCSVILNRITGIFPFSLAEVCVLLGIPAGVFLLARLLFRLAKGRKRGESVGRRELLADAVYHAGCFLSVVLFWFVFFCGVNYERYPFSHYSGLTIQSSTKEELYDLCVSLADAASESYVEMPQTEKGDFDHRKMARAAAEAMKSLGDEYPQLAGNYGRTKPVFCSTFLSRTETTGIYIPFTMEANVNVACTDYTIPATMCHELSHLRGFMREDEANYIAYLACVRSEDAALRYSGLMLALVYTGNQLYREDPALYREARAHYSEDILRDFVRDSEYWAEFEDTVISTTANAVNDTYLKANNQTDGAKSYGRMVDLLLAEYRKEHSRERNTN